MATPKKTPSSNASRTRVVPVRVIKSTQPERQRQEPIPQNIQPRVTTLPPSKPVHQPKPLEPRGADRRMLMWTGVIIVTAVIFVLWVGYMRQYLTSSGSSDSFFGKIAHDIGNVFKQFKLNGTTNSTNARDAELNKIRNDVFPNINVNAPNREFSTNTNSAVTR